jgi:hypothetical protein
LRDEVSRAPAGGTVGGCSPCRTAFLRTPDRAPPGRPERRHRPARGTARPAGARGGRQDHRPARDRRRQDHARDPPPSPEHGARPGALQPGRARAPGHRERPAPGAGRGHERGPGAPPQGLRARGTRRSCAGWRSISSGWSPPRARRAARSSAPAGTTPSRPSCSPGSPIPKCDGPVLDARPD